MPSIREIHAGFLAGNAEAISAVQGWVRQVVFGARWRFDDPEAVQQDALIELLRAVRRSAVRDPQAFQKFAWTVTKRVCIEHHRRRAQELPLPDEDPVESPAEAPDALLERARDLELLLYVYDRLPEDCRRLWQWVYGERWPAARVAEALAIRVGAVRVRVHRCLERARRLAIEAAG